MKNKIAGILDPVNPNLAPNVWTEDNKLRPEVRARLIKDALQVTNSDELKGIYVLGSITGYK